MKFPSCPKYFLSYFHASSLECHCVLPRRQMSKDTRKQWIWFLQGTMPGKCENLLLPLAAGALPGINDNRGKFCNVTWCRLKYRAQVKKTYVCIYICMYINTQIIKTPPLRARSCKYFLLSHHSERLTAVRKICNTEDGAMWQ